MGENFTERKENAYESYGREEGREGKKKEREKEL